MIVNYDEEGAEELLKEVGIRIAEWSLVESEIYEQQP